MNTRTININIFDTSENFETLTVARDIYTMNTSKRYGTYGTIVALGTLVAHDSCFTEYCSILFLNYTSTVITGIILLDLHKFQKLVKSDYICLLPLPVRVNVDFPFFLTPFLRE